MSPPRYRGPEARAFLHRAIADGVVVDLSLGGWTPAQAAGDIALQLALSLPQSDATKKLEHRTLSDAASRARVIGDGIDEEAAGITSIRIADRHASLLTEALFSQGVRVVAFIAPLFDLPLRELDLWLARRLAQQGGLEVAWLVFEPSLDGDVTSDDLVPSLLHTSSQIGIPLRGGPRLVDPARRRDPRSAKKSLFGRLAAEHPTAPWRTLYIATFGHTLFVDVASLFDFGALAQTMGASDLAIDCFTRADECAPTPTLRAVARSLAQGARIASHRFAEASTVADVNRAAPAPLREYVELMRAWGQVLSGSPQEARDALETAVTRIEQKTIPDDYDLYILNIAALRRMRCGDDRGAQELEQRITDRRVECDKDARLAYVNLLNMSRLARRGGNMERACALHRRAFDTVWGAAEPWEHFHFQILEAQAATSLGHDPSVYWCRAALIWLSEPCPEAAPDRAVHALLGKTRFDAVEERLVAIDTALTGKLGFGKARKRKIRFSRRAIFPRCDALIATPAAILGLRESDDRASRPSAHLLACRLADALPLSQGIEAAEITLDLNGLGPLSADQGSLRRFALRSGALQWTEGDNERAIDEDVRNGWRSEAVLSLSPIVAAVSPTENGRCEVSFRRRLGLRMLQGETARVASALIEGPRLARDIDGAPRLMFAPELESVVCVDWPQP